MAPMFVEIGGGGGNTCRFVVSVGHIFHL